MKTVLLCLQKLYLEQKVLQNLYASGEFCALCMFIINVKRFWSK